MVEKIADYEGTEYLKEAGEFEFEVVDYELKDSKNGDPMAVFTVKSDKGQTTLYHVLTPKCRWSYNNLIKACLKLDTKEKIQAFECDYELVGQQLIGKKFMGTVEEQTYEKAIKIPQDDGTFIDGKEEKTSYKIVEYNICK